MQDHNYYLVICFFLLNSIRFIVFGISKDFNSIIFNYIQFIVFNNYLHFSNNPNVNIISDITLWSFFGLSPHPNADGSINLYGLMIKAILAGVLFFLAQKYV